MKRLLLIVVDAIASPVAAPAIEAGRLPNLQALSQAGSLRSESIAIFPSITPAATSSIITGRYPHGHGVLGYHWYDLEHDTVVYYGDDFWVIWQQGFGDFFDDFLCKLNHERLRTDTLFQTVERAGLKAANLNYLIYRGEVKHTANVPFLISLLPGIPDSTEVYGPSILFFGDLVNTQVDHTERSIETNGGLFNRFGFDDANTGGLLRQLAELGALPDFTMAYFPDNDYRSHEVGPQAAITALEGVDEELGRFFEVFGGIDKTLDEFCLILTGDHSQTAMIADEDRASIQLGQILSPFDISEPGTRMERDDQIVICPDMRSAQIYFRNLTADNLEFALQELLKVEAIDQVIWRAADLGQRDKGYYITTQQHGRLHFWPGAGDTNHARDRYGCEWSWRGDLGAVSGQLSDDNILTFPDYPNAFERLVGGLDCPNSGHLWVTARPGYEFQLDHTTIHPGGGSHGSLHVQDSVSPLIMAGAPAGVELPQYPRAVDVNPLCLTVLGLEPARPVGASQICAG